MKFAFQIFGAILLERNTRTTALLRAIVDESILADVEIPASGAAFPVVRISLYEVLLKLVVVGKSRKRLAPDLNDLLIDLDFAFTQRPQLAGVVVNDADRDRKTEFLRATGNRCGVFWIFARANHRVDVYLELRMLGQPLEFSVEHLQAFLGDFVRPDIVDADLKVVESGAVQSPDALRSKQVSIGDERRDRAAMANAVDNLIEIGMEQGLATANGDDRCAELRKAVDAAQHEFGRDRVRDIIELIAITTGKIAAADRHDVGHDGMPARLHRPGHHPSLTHMEGRSKQLAPNTRQGHDAPPRIEISYSAFPRGM